MSTITDVKHCICYVGVVMLLTVGNGLGMFELMFECHAKNVVRISCFVE